MAPPYKSLKYALLNRSDGFNLSFIRKCVNPFQGANHSIFATLFSSAALFHFFFASSFLILCRLIFFLIRSYTPSASLNMC